MNGCLKYVKLNLLVNFFILSSLLFTSFIHAESATIKLSNEILNDSGIVRPIEKVVLSPVGINTILKNSNEKYVQEVAYFFYKFGFKSPPVSHVLFEDGEIFSLNPNWRISQFANSNEKGTILILLAYSEEFDLEKFSSLLNKFNQDVLEKEIKHSEIKSISDIEIKKISVENDTNSSKIVFSEYEGDYNLKNYFSSLNYSEKTQPELKLKDITPLKDVEPNIATTINIEIENNSDFDFILSSNNSLKLSFVEDSEFFLNDKWLSPKIAQIIDKGFIKSKSTTKFSLPIQSSLIPKSIEEELILSFNDTVLDRKNINVSTKDNGQKILKILETGVGFANIRKDPNQSSEEIGKAPVGQSYVYVEIINGYYKILFGGKEGWVSENYIEEVKE